MAMVILLGQKGSGPGEFANPRGVAMSAENEILMADMFNRRVQVHDMKGVHRRQFPTATPGGYMVAPEDVTIDGGGNLWIVGKYGTNSVAVKYNRDGLPLATIPLRQTAFVRGVAVNPKSHQVLVTETDGRTGEVLMFGPDGGQERRFGRQEGMLHPWYVTTNMEGNILVSDLDTNNVYMYNPVGRIPGQVQRTLPPSGGPLHGLAREHHRGGLGEPAGGGADRPGRACPVRRLGSRETLGRGDRAGRADGGDVRTAEHRGHFHTLGRGGWTGSSRGD
ncbi:tripartite motif-containing protein 2-like [Branchiostoma lanceolatum]|uniref:tripartite motif-containing protein 2-like n=1 Tax=Branchiostoma lanceolatum TaxID=7740 RepID=UPI0034544301